MQHGRTRRRATRAALSLALLALAGPALAQVSDPGRPPAQDDEHPPWSFHTSLGFTLDPETFLMAFGAEFAATEALGIGPLLQLGVSDDDAIVAPTLQARYGFDLREHVEDEDLGKLRPFLQGGLGFAFIDKDRPGPGDDDDVEFLLNMGFGVEYPLTDHFSLGNSVLFNVLPWDAVGENFFFSWQFATARFRF